MGGRLRREPLMMKQRGYFGFRIMADLHNALWPGKDVNGNSRIAHKIYRALDRAYTDGFEDAIQLDETHLARARRRICGREQDI